MPTRRHVLSGSSFEGRLEKPSLRMERWEKEQGSSGPCCIWIYPLKPNHSAPTMCQAESQTTAMSQFSRGP